MVLLLTIKFIACLVCNGVFTTWALWLSIKLKLVLIVILKPLQGFKKVEILFKSFIAMINNSKNLILKLLQEPTNSPHRRECLWELWDTLLIFGLMRWIRKDRVLYAFNPVIVELRLISFLLLTHSALVPEFNDIWDGNSGSERAIKFMLTH